MAKLHRARHRIELDQGGRIKEDKRGAGAASFGIQPLPPQTIVDGTIMDQGAVVEAIRQLWEPARASAARTSRSRSPGTR